MIFPSQTQRELLVKLDIKTTYYSTEINNFIDFLSYMHSNKQNVMKKVMLLIDF